MPTIWEQSMIPHPPSYHPHAAAVWLVSRHPQLAELASRIPGLVQADDAGDFSLDLDVLARQFNSHDGNGPSALGFMTGTERARLRLLAVFAPGIGVRFHVGCLGGFDEAGKRLLTDWFTAVRVQAM
jgi:hypothetical protein